MSVVLVTGGLGVNGAWVTRQLIEQGINCVVYSRNLNTELVKDIADKVELVAGDILDLPRLIHTIKSYGIDRIIHLAAIMPGPLEANPYMTYRIQVDGTINVLEAARLTDIKRVVYSSTQGVYDRIVGEYGYPTYKPIDEDYPQVPRTVYGTTKLFGEQIGLDYNRIYGVDFIIQRYAWIYGPGKQARHGMLALHSKIIESAMLGKPLKIPRGGEELVESIYCRDVANSIILACFAENLEHRIFNIGTGKGESFHRLIEIIDNIFDDVDIEIGPGLNPLGTPDASYMVMNIDRARKELGFSPRYDLEAGTKDYIETLRRLDIRPM